MVPKLFLRSKGALPPRQPRRLPSVGYAAIAVAVVGAILVTTSAGAPAPPSYATTSDKTAVDAALAIGHPVKRVRRTIVAPKVVKQPGQEPKVVHDHHVEGVFPEHTWLHLLERAGFEPRLVPGDPEDEDAFQPVFVARRPEDA